jgi:hypothetical protein
MNISDAGTGTLEIAIKTQNGDLLESGSNDFE